MAAERPEMKRVVIVRLDHLGDLMLMTPLVRALHVSGWTVDLVVPGWLRPLFEANPHVAAAHAIEDIAPGFPATWPKLARWMWSQDYAMVLLPNANQRQQLLASLFSGVSRRYAMWSGVWGRLTWHTCLRSSIRERPRPFAEILLDLARAAGVPLAGMQLDLVVLPAEIAAALAWLRERGFDPSVPLVGVHPGCAGNTCNLPPSVYGEVAADVLERSRAVVVATGSDRERSLTAAWPADVISSGRFINAVGELSLRQLAAVISQFSAYVIPSTGPLHMANALNIATVSPFCSWSTLTSAVWGNQNGRGEVVCPTESACEKWRAAKARRLTPGAVNSNCDFRGEVTSAQIVDRVLRILTPA